MKVCFAAVFFYADGEKSIWKTRRSFRAVKRHLQDVTVLPPAWVCVGKLSHNIFFEVIFRERGVFYPERAAKNCVCQIKWSIHLFLLELYSEAANCNTPNDDNQQKITKKQPETSSPGRGSRKDSPKRSTAMQELLFPDTRQKQSEIKTIIFFLRF